MPIIVSEGFNVVAPFVIDRRLIVDSVDSTPNSLVNLITTYNYTNMIVWVRDEKAFYYLIDSPTADGGVASDWVKFSGGATGGCAKSGYVPGFAFTGSPTATASVVFSSPYQSASYSVVVTGEEDSASYIYSVTDKSPTGFTIVIPTSVPIGATAMWITNCYDGSGLSSGGAGPQGPTGPGGSTADTSVRIAWEGGQLTSYTLTASTTASTIFFPQLGNSFDSPVGDIEVTLDPNLSVSGINRNFRFILDNFQRVGTGSVGFTWSVIAPMEGFTSGERVIEWPEGRIEPQVVEFVWNDSSSNYEMFRYQAEPFLKNVVSENSYGKDFTSTKRQTGFFGGNSSASVGSSISSTVYPAGSILFIQEAFVGCESNTTTATGITISFGLRESDGSQISTGDFSPDLTTFGLSTTDEVIFPRTSLANFATGSVFYSNSPVGIIRINRPMMIYMRLQGGSLAAGTFIKCTVPYIVDVNSVNAASGAAGVVGPPNQTSGGGSAIDLEEIAFGTGTGITSSDLFTYDVSNTNLIFGSNSITFSNTLGFNNTVIGGLNNTICSDSFGVFNIPADNNSIIGGYSNCLNSGGGSIIGSKNSYSSFEYSSILGGNCQKTQGNGRYSALIGGEYNLLCNSERSVIIGGLENEIRGTFSISTGLISASSSAIIGGRTNTIYVSNYSNITSSYNSLIQCSNRSLIIGGADNSIACKSQGSLILGGQQNIITQSSVNSAIQNSLQSSIYSSNCSMILGGLKNKISGAINSSIISSNCSKLYENYNSSIVASCCSCIVSVAPTSGNSSVMFAGLCNKMYGASRKSAIIGGYCNTMTFSSNSLILGGTKLKMDTLDNFVYVPSLRGFGSLQFTFATTSTFLNLNENHFTVLVYPNPSSPTTISLPSASSAPHRLYVIKKDGSSTQSVVRIDPQSGDEIEGYSGYIELINPWDYNILQSDGVNLWIKLGGAVGLNL